MVVASPFTYAVDPGDEGEKPDTLHLERGGVKEDSSGGGSKEAVTRG